MLLQDVRLLVAVSLAELLRLYVPDAPFNDEILRVSSLRLFRKRSHTSTLSLQDILELFISLFDCLMQPNSPHFSRCLILLESLANINAFNVLCNLYDPTDLVTNLFSKAFEIAK